MTTSDSPYVTRDELVARMAELELRIERRLAQFEQRVNDHFRNQTRLLLTLILPLYAALAIAALVAALR